MKKRPKPFDYAKKTVDLAAAPVIDVATIARIFETSVGPQHVNSEGDRVAALAATDLIAGGTIRYGSDDSIYPHLVPARDARLTVRDLEGPFIDRPYEVWEINAESDGIPLKEILRIDHMFGVRAGMLKFSVAPPATNRTPVDDQIQGISFSDSGLEQLWPTLRQRRARERAEAAEAAAYARLTTIQRARLDSRRKTTLGRQIIQIANLPHLEHAAVARILKAKLGPAVRSGSNRRIVDSALGETEFIEKGEISTFKDDVGVTVKPARRVGLTLTDLAPLLLDLPYHQETQWAHVGSGVASNVSNILHIFDTKAGALIIYARPKEDAEGGPIDLVERIHIKNEKDDWSREKTTLRAERARDKARAARAKPTVAP